MDIEVNSNVISENIRIDLVDNTYDLRCSDQLMYGYGAILETVEGGGNIVVALYVLNSNLFLFIKDSSYNLSAPESQFQSKFSDMGGSYRFTLYVDGLVEKLVTYKTVPIDIDFLKDIDSLINDPAFEYIVKQKIEFYSVLNADERLVLGTKQSKELARMRREYRRKMNISARICDVARYGF